MLIRSKTLVAVFGSALPIKQRGYAIPVQLGDHSYAGKSTQEDLEQHTPTAWIEIGLDRRFK
tara:strand:- start:301 stop:486 length:186 start_codon:yes stop_codon:yes gene_type:complete